MVECLAGMAAALFLLLGAVQLFFLLAGQGAVETASHFAARRFALSARLDIRKARQTALFEAMSQCRLRPGCGLSDASMTSVDLLKEGGAETSAARAGNPYVVRITHGVELIVPWVNRIFYALAPLPKTRIGDRFYLLLRSQRLVTVE